MKLIVDDRSSDNTREIAKACGWTVTLNEGNGISDGANTALRHVESDLFESFEQDLLLALDWWNKIPAYLLDSNVTVASGMRFASQPLGVQRMQQYVAKKYREGIAGFVAQGQGNGRFYAGENSGQHHL